MRLLAKCLLPSNLLPYLLSPAQPMLAQTHVRAQAHAGVRINGRFDIAAETRDFADLVRGLSNILRHPVEVISEVRLPLRQYIN